MIESEQDELIGRLIRQRREGRDRAAVRRERLRSIAECLEQAGRALRSYADTGLNHHAIAGVLSTDPLDGCDLVPAKQAADEYRKASEELADIEERARSLGA